MFCKFAAWKLLIGHACYYQVAHRNADVPRAKSSIAHIFSSTHSLLTCRVTRVTTFCLWSSERADTASPSTQHPPDPTDSCTEPIPALAASQYDVGMPKAVQRYQQEFSLYTQKEKGSGPWAIPSSRWELLSLIPRLKSLAAVVSHAHILPPPLPPASYK